MPHADSSLVPADISTKPQFYAHVTSQLSALLEGHRYWVSNLAQASALLYHSFAGSSLYGYLSDAETPVINWCGFYLHPPSSASHGPSSISAAPLVLGPYHGRPACISITPIAGRGVCADSFVTSSAVVVMDVEAYPNHIACDGETKSEIVLPLRMRTNDGLQTVGVLDLDSTKLATFDDDDLKGLEEITRILTEACDWA